MSDIQKQSVRLSVVLALLVFTAGFVWKVNDFANQIDKRLTRIEYRLGISEPVTTRE